MGETIVIEELEDLTIPRLPTLPVVKITKDYCDRRGGVIHKKGEVKEVTKELMIWLLGKDICIPATAQELHDYGWGCLGTNIKKEALFHIKNE